MLNYPQQIIDFTLDTIFPIKCLSCGLFSPSNKHQYLCKKCANLIPLKKKLECMYCGRPSPLGLTCRACKNSSYIDQLLAVTDYKNPLIQKLIKTLKYRYVKDVGLSLSLIMEKYIHWLSKEKKLNFTTNNPILIPVPLHYLRLNQRGFNQSEIIARQLADNYLLDTDANILIRTKNSKPQADIKDEQNRFSNIGEIFKVTAPEKIKDRTIILIDDVCTTGATLNQATKALKENGAKEIIGFVIAKG